MKGLKEKRKAKKLKQAELAEMLGISYRNYIAYETGQTTPNIKAIISMENFFDCQLKDLI